MNIVNMERSHIKEMLALAIDEYKTECKKCPSLVTYDFKKELKDIITRLLDAKFCKVAVEQEKVVGYIGFNGPKDGFFGDVKGAFSPLGTSAFGGADRMRTALRLLQAIEKELVSQNIYSLAISYYAHDEQIKELFLLQGFGARCSDLIRTVSDEAKHEKSKECLIQGIVVEELKGMAKRMVLPLKIRLMLHLSTSPIFMPQNISEAKVWFSNEDLRIFAAKKDGQIIGFMATDRKGETFISEYKDMDNICAAYVEETYRGSGVAQLLLEYVTASTKKEGKQYLGVDCETLNPNAFYFWKKEFIPYTYSFARRIDERI